MSVVLKVNGSSIPNPQTIQVNVADVDYESGRAQDGVMNRDRVRGGSGAVRSIECVFPPMNSSTMSNLLQAIGGASMQLTYPDPYTGANRTAKVYCGDRSAPMYTMINGKWQWESLSVTFIEF